MIPETKPTAYDSLMRLLENGGAANRTEAIVAVADFRQQVERETRQKQVLDALLKLHEYDELALSCHERRPTVLPRRREAEDVPVVGEGALEVGHREVHRAHRRERRDLLVRHAASVPGSNRAARQSGYVGRRYPLRRSGSEQA